MARPSAAEFEQEHVDCVACGPAAKLPLPLWGEPRFVACVRCGLVFQTPRPTLAALTAYYGRAYYEHGGGVMGGGAELPPIRGKDVPFSPRSLALAEWLRPHVGAGQLVAELGCGAGEHLAHARAVLGVDALGIEPSVLMGRHARDAYGLDVREGGVNELASAVGSRRVRGMILSHVLEHFHDPLAALAAVRGVLDAAGVLVVEVPNAHVPNRQKRLRRWFAIEHLYYFSANTLTMLLGRAGFTVERVEEAQYLRVLARPTQAHAQPTSAWRELAATARGLVSHEVHFWKGRLGGRAGK